MTERRGPWNSLSQIVGRIEDLEAAIAALLNLDWQNSVLSIFDPTGALPVGPSVGDRYISSATANGWTDTYIYQWTGTVWGEQIPNEGWATWVEDENKVYIFDDTGWVKIGTTTDHNILANLQGGTTAEFYHLTQAIYDSFDYNGSVFEIENGLSGSFALKDNSSNIVLSLDHATGHGQLKVFGTAVRYLIIEQNGLNAYISNTALGGIVSLTAVKAITGQSTLFVGNPDGAAELYHAGVKKLETQSTGILVSGYINATGNSLNLNSGGSGTAYIRNISATGDIYITVGGQLGLSYTYDGASELFYANIKKLSTTAAGISITDGVATAATIGFSADDLKIDNNDPGGKIILTGEKSATGESTLASLDPDGAAELYHAGQLKFNTDTQYLNGVEDATAIVLSSDSGNPPTITLTFTGTVYIWSDGIRYAKTGSDNIQITDVTGVHVIYYDGSTLTVVANPSHDALDAIIEDKAIVAIVYWNTNSNTSPVLASELHGIKMSGATHHYLHDTRGAVYEDGAGISGYILNTASDAALTFDLSDLEFYDEDIKVDIIDGLASVQYEQVLTGDAEIPVLYKDAVDQSWVEQAASTLPYLVGGSPRLQYMDKNNNFALTEIGVAKFCSYWLVATNDWQYPIKMIPGDQQYDSSNDAENNAPNEIVNFGDLPSKEFIVLYQFVMQGAAGSGGTKNAKIIKVIDYRESGKSGTAANPATDHGGLSGLNDNDHPQYRLTTDAPTVHGNGSHSSTFITASGVTYANLNGNGDVGVGATQVAVGNHGHAQLHTRLHAITDVLDHSAGNWKVVHTNGAGQVIELALGVAGTVLQSNGPAAAPSFSAAGVPTKEKWFAPEYDGNQGNYRVKSIIAAGSERFTFMIPSDFTSLTSLVLVGFPSAGAAGASKDIDLYSDYAGVGQDAQTHQESDTTSLYTIPAANIIWEFNISGVFNSLSAGDYCGILVDQKGIGGSVYYLGIRLKYS